MDKWENKNKPEKNNKVEETVINEWLNVLFKELMTN